MKQYTIRTLSTAVTAMLLVTLLLFAVACVAQPVRAETQGGIEEPPSSRVMVVQTGTIPDNKVKAAVEAFRRDHCPAIGVFSVDLNYSNVYCTYVVIAEPGDKMPSYHDSHDERRYEQYRQAKIKRLQERYPHLSYKEAAYVFERKLRRG